MRQGKLMQISWTIQPGQWVTTGPEQNFACREVTNCVKPKGWRAGEPFSGSRNPAPVGLSKEMRMTYKRKNANIK